MPTTSTTNVFRDLRRAALLGAGAEIGDGQLLEDFVVRRDEAAFAVLVRRYGPLVFGVCKRVTGNTHDAEDAFQATFLVLARKAATVLPRAMVGNWLHGVAYRTARRAKAVAARRWAREKQVIHMPEPIVETDPLQELEPVLDGELNRLPEKYRVPLVLCDLEGSSPKQIARRLGLPEGTVSSRLTRARKMLAQRLRQRGFALSGAALATMVRGKSALANVPLPLASSTIKAATMVAAGCAAKSAVSAEVVVLTEGVLKAMLLTKLKIAMGVLLAASVLAYGLGTLVPPSFATAQIAPGKSKSRQPAVNGGAQAQPAKAPTRWKERLKIERPENKVQTFGVAISPDGLKIVVAYGPGVIKVLDAKTGQELVTLSEEGAPGIALAFSPDGQLVARSDDESVVLYSADSGQIKARLEINSHIKSVAFSPDGKTLATGSSDTLRLWDLATNKVIREFKLQAWSVAFSPDGKKLAVAHGSDNTAKVWDMATGKELATFKQPDGVLGVAFSPDGKTVAAASGSGEDQQVKLWDLATGKVRATLTGPVDGLNSSLAFSPYGKILAVAGRHDQDPVEKDFASVVRLWDPATGKQIADLDMQGDHGVHMQTSLGFSRNGILVTASDAAVRIWEPDNGPKKK
jgi:RNA polymerase sigma factor (sigma-70 family)